MIEIYQPSNEPESPCISRCCLNDDDICIGCFRSLEEIKQWRASDAECKQAILAAAKARKIERNNFGQTFE